jgi:hypothetical protein
MRQIIAVILFLAGFMLPLRAQEPVNKSGPVRQGKISNIDLKGLLSVVNGSQNWDLIADANTQFIGPDGETVKKGLSDPLFQVGILVEFQDETIHGKVRQSIRIRKGVLSYAQFKLAELAQRNDSSAIYSNRSYFGVLRVKEVPGAKLTDKEKNANFNELVHGHILHGQNFMLPGSSSHLTASLIGLNLAGMGTMPLPLPTLVGLWSEPASRNLGRLATTYFHPRGPVGKAFDNFDWFNDVPGAFGFDARSAASFVGMNMAGMGLTSVPLPTLVDLWSHAPFATIGLGTGTMASWTDDYSNLLQLFRDKEPAPVKDPGRK